MNLHTTYNTELFKYPKSLIKKIIKNNKTIKNIHAVNLSKQIYTDASKINEKVGCQLTQITPTVALKIIKTNFQQQLIYKYQKDII